MVISRRFIPAISGLGALFAGQRGGEAGIALVAVGGVVLGQ